MKLKTHNELCTQSGRSMVEMLGVLAVIGVLSVAGVAGYGVVMDKHKATDLINEGNIRAAAVAAQVAAGKTPNLDGFDKTTFTDAELVGDTQFKLNATGISESVCNNLKTIAGKNGIIHEIGDDCSYLLYSNFLSAASGDGSAASEEEGLWEPTLCYDNNDCGPCEQCDGGECIKFKTDDCECSDNEMLVGGVACLPCNYPYDIDEEFTQDCETKCGQNRTIVEIPNYGSVCGLTRCPSGYFMGRYHACFSCHETNEIEVNSASDCSCSNRTFVAYESGGVSLESITAPAEPAGTCVLTGCMTGYFRSADNECLSCNTPGEVPVYSEEDCTTCSNRHFEQAFQAPVIEMAMAAPSADGKCVLDSCSSGYFKSSSPGDCFPCNEKNSYEVASESDCTGSCNNRKFIPGSSISVSYSATSAPANEWGYCALKNCPSGYAASDDYGNCTRVSPDAFNNNSSGCTGAGYRYCTANNTCVASNCCEDVDITACQECISSSGQIVTFNSGDYCYENDESGKCDNNANCMTPSSYNGNSSGCTNAGYHYCSISNKCVATDGACCSVSNSTCYQCDSSTGAVTKPGSETSCNYNNQGANSGECNGNGSCVKKKTYSLVSGAYSRAYCTTGSGPGGSPKCSTTASLSTIGLSGSESAATVISKLQSLTYTGTAYSNQNVYLTDARINSDGSITTSPGSGASGSCLCVN